MSNDERDKYNIMEKTLFHLQPTQCVLLVVDIQQRLMPVINEAERVCRNSVLLIKAAKSLAIPILATTQYAARIGALLPEIESELGAVKPMDKLEFDCFANPDVFKAVRILPDSINTIIVCGVESHICIYQTVLGGLANGYRVWIAGDAVSSRQPFNHQVGLQRMREMGAMVGSAEMIVYDLLHQAGTPAFKELLPFLK